jgi:hypothetical protein
MKKWNLIMVAVMVCFAFIAVSFGPVSAERQHEKNIPAKGKNGKNKPEYPIKLPRTGQTQSDSAGINDDGALQMGVEWPVPRFTDNGDGTVTDNLTRLVWLKDANCFGIIYWYGALGKTYYLKNGDCGLSDGSVVGDWRVPNKNELGSLVDIKLKDAEHYDYTVLPDDHPFINVVAHYYWTSSTATYNWPAAAWTLDMYTGATMYDKAKSESYFVWPVRSDKEIHGGHGEH